MAEAGIAKCITFLILQQSHHQHANAVTCSLIKTGSMVERTFGDL